MKKIVIDQLTKTKVTVPLIVLVFCVYVGWKADSFTVDYLDDFFITKAVAEEQYTVIQESVKENRTLIVSHIQTYELNENARETQGVADQLYELELYVAANGANDLTNRRQQELTARLQRLSRIRACIIRNSRLEDDDEPENCAAIL